MNGTGRLRRLALAPAQESFFMASFITFKSVFEHSPQPAGIVERNITASGSLTTGMS
jgi:hypothetical protein